MVAWADVTDAHSIPVHCMQLAHTESSWWPGQMIQMPKQCLSMMFSLHTVSMGAWTHDAGAQAVTEHYLQHLLTEHELPVQMVSKGLEDSRPACFLMLMLASPDHEGTTVQLRLMP